MKLFVNKSSALKGEIEIPASKSHTIRAIVIASLAKGVSTIIKPLYSDDTTAAINGCRALGAKITKSESNLVIEGVSGNPKQPRETIDTLNSGTSTNILTGIAALGNFDVVIDGDDSIRKRPLTPLLNALTNLGASVVLLNNTECPPVRIKGPIKGGKTELFAKSSQYLTSLLIACPLALGDSEIFVKEICEIPYVRMTLEWLKEQEIKVEYENDLTYFYIPGRQSYQPFEKGVVADWSSATFPIVAGTIVEGSDILIKGLDLNDCQGDKAIIDYINRMGGKISSDKKGIRVEAAELVGLELDLNETPDALPAVAVLSCFARGRTIIKNVAHARIKETDRIKVMYQELSKMGAKIEETNDGLIIEESELKGISLNGHNDHRVVMALSIAGLTSPGTTEITTPEAVTVTFPNYFEKMRALGAEMQVG